MTDADVNTPGDWMLSLTETAFQQMEGIYGQLKSFSAIEEGAKRKNKASYFIGPAPLTRVILKTYTGTKPPSLSDKTLVAKGSLWVEGKKTQAAAYR